jgi:hypothetical protein
MADDVEFWKEQTDLWRKMVEKEQTKYSFPESIAIDLSQAQYLKPLHMDWAKGEIARSGMSFMFTIPKAEVKAIKIVPSVYGNVNYGGTIDAFTNSIIIADMYFMPWWDLPGAIIHEAVHLWQAKLSLPSNEIMAYMVQQVLYEKNKYGIENNETDNIFKRNSVAAGLIING